MPLLLELLGGPAGGRVKVVEEEDTFPAALVMFDISSFEVELSAALDMERLRKLLVK